MVQPLFNDKPLRFEKSAALAQMGDNPQDWGPKIISELHKSLPFLAEFDAKLVLDKMEPEQGYAMGEIQVKNKTEMTAGDEVKGRGVKHARIPVLIRNFELQPFDVFFRDKGAFPLTESRFREKMFRPDTFDTTRTVPSDRSISEDTSPPFQGRGIWTEGGETKVAAKRYLMDAIAPTLSKTALDDLVELVRGDSDLAHALLTNPACHSVMKMAGLASQTKQASAGEMLDVMRSRIRPTVIQITKLANGNVKFKWANPQAFAPQEETVPPQEAAVTAGPELASMPPDSSMTAAPEAEAKEIVLEETALPVVTFGEYKVERLPDGKELLGWVIPSLLKFTLEPTEMSLFANGSEYAVAPAILGKAVGRGANLPEGEPRGYGVFYFETQGKVAATVPVTLQGITKGPDGTESLTGNDDMGQEVNLTITPGISNITSIGEGSFAIPDHWKFLPLDGRIEVAAGDAEPMDKAAHLLDTHIIRCDDSGIYSLDSLAFRKVAAHVKFVDFDQAEFMLACAGLDPLTAREKLASAQKGGKVEFLAKLATITPWEERTADGYHEAQELVASLPYLRRNLVKEATTVEDADTVDKMLALGFLTPENMSIFVEYIPELEKAASKLADLLVASRLGMTQIPDTAARRAMFSMDEVIQGLRKLEHASS